MPTPVPEPVAVIRDLREKLFALTPDQIGAAPGPDAPNVWGVLMETGYPEALATLVSLLDGTTSLYLGHGGGIIGGGEHDTVKTAARELLTTAEAALPALTPTAAFPLPDVGRVKFYVLTFGGVHTADAEQATLGQGTHALSDLFYAGHEVIGELRRIDEARRK